MKISFSSPKNKLSGVNKAYIDIRNGQKFELLDTHTYLWVDLYFLSDLKNHNFFKFTYVKTCKNVLSRPRMEVPMYLYLGRTSLLCWSFLPTILYSISIETYLFEWIDSTRKSIKIATPWVYSNGRTYRK